ncbi:MAG TPA: hypothetical protein VG276_00390 [Actinomycetes bacterium]|nr:hypothetical protein [Actinomycetes bacterium]
MGIVEQPGGTGWGGRLREAAGEGVEAAGRPVGGVVPYAVQQIGDAAVERAGDLERRDVGLPARTAVWPNAAAAASSVGRDS